MWYLIVNRSLKTYRLYGPFDTEETAMLTGKRLALAYGWVRNYTTTTATRISYTVDGGFRIEVNV